MKIQFGCGKRKKDGWVNVDVIKENRPEVVCNMNHFPYPFHNNSAEEIYCNMTLEHIESPLKAICEFHRILKPKGKLYIAVPHVSSISSLNAEDHIRVFWSHTFSSFYTRSSLFDTAYESWKEEYPRFSYMKVKLIFPQNKLKLLSMPFMWLFSEGRYAQAFYEHFFIRNLAL